MSLSTREDATLTDIKLKDRYTLYGYRRALHVRAFALRPVLTPHAWKMSAISQRPLTVRLSTSDAFVLGAYRTDYAIVRMGKIANSSLRHTYIGTCVGAYLYVRR